MIRNNNKPRDDDVAHVFFGCQSLLSCMMIAIYRCTCTIMPPRVTSFKDTQPLKTFANASKSCAAQVRSESSRAQKRS